MDAGQRSTFRRAALAVRETIRPVVVTYQGTDYQGSGSHGGTGMVELMTGGTRKNSEVSFTISKEAMPDPIEINQTVTIGGVRYQVRKRWGTDEGSPGWSYWAEIWGS